VSSSEEKNKKYAASCHMVAGFMESNRFMRLFHSETCRFGPGFSELFSRLRKDLLFQARQSLSAAFSSGVRDSGGKIYDLSPEVVFKQMGREIAEYANTLVPATEFRKSDIQFIVPRGEDMMQAVHAAFNDTMMNNTCIWLREVDNVARHSSSNFYTRNFISSLGVFVESLHTLAYATPYQGYEKMLGEMVSRGVRYFTAGYPHDVLAHDVRNLRERGKDVEAIMARKEYVSTGIVMKKGACSQLIEGFELYYNLHAA
jgi:hypothetical protein